MISVSDPIHCNFCATTVARDYWDAEWASTWDDEHVCPECLASGAFVRCACDRAEPVALANCGRCQVCDEFGTRGEA